MSNVFRTKEMCSRYDECKKSEEFKSGCVLCKKVPIQEFQYWRIVLNDFPYDRIAKVHNMILPIRHIAGDGLNTEEIAELFEIKKKYLQEYDYIIETSKQRRSIPDHFHLHLIMSKSSLDEAI